MKSLTRPPACGRAASSSSALGGASSSGSSSIAGTPSCARSARLPVTTAAAKKNEVTLLDYGAGNVKSIRNAIKKLGFTIKDVSCVVCCFATHARARRAVAMRQNLLHDTNNAPVAAPARRVPPRRARADNCDLHKQPTNKTGGEAVRHHGRRQAHLPGRRQLRAGDRHPEGARLRQAAAGLCRGALLWTRARRFAAAAAAAAALPLPLLSLSHRDSP